MSWIGVDLDGTLAHYDTWRGATHIGDPIPAMVDRVKRWRLAGREVRIVTARVNSSVPSGEQHEIRERIYAWCRQHIGEELPVTAEKDYGMDLLYDDRARQVLTNTGIIAEIL